MSYPRHRLSDWKERMSKSAIKSKKRTNEKNPNYGADFYRAKMEKKASRKKPEQCEICGIFGKDLKKGLCFDHDHVTGRFRGWICGRCNIALGLIKDNTQTLRTMIIYLEAKD